MNPYSADLRVRAVTAYERGEGSYAQIAKRYEICEATLRDWHRRYRATGSFNPHPHSGGSRPRLNDEDREHVVQTILGCNDATLEELRDNLEAQRGVHTWHAAERQTPAWEARREKYKQEIKDIPPEDRVYLDESGVNCGMAREYGRAKKGKRAFGSRPKRRGKNTTLAGIISGEGNFRVHALRSAMTALKFLGFVAACVVPMLRPGQVVIIDNPRIHRVKGLRELVEGAQCHLLYLPTYSPELNPIEECWSKLKAGLRKLKARTQEMLEASVQHVALSVTRQDIVGWFAHSDAFLVSVSPLKLASVPSLDQYW